VVVVYLMGLPSARNLELLSNQDFVWGIGLMISGAFIAFAIWKSEIHVIRSDINAIRGDWKAGTAWAVSIRFIVPILALALLAWWMFLSATVFAPDEWYNPFNPFSVMTCLAQFALVLGVFILLNKKITRRIY
jgi:NSS family neurotransmitter:Na+ symporter